MMFRKVAKCLMISALAVFLTVGCSQPSSSDSWTGNTDNTGDTGDTEKPVADPSVVNFKDYHIKVSKLPYDSTGLTVLALAESEKYKDVKKELGKVISTEKDAVVEKTVSLPGEYDKLYIVFVNDSDELKYFCNIIPQNYNKTEALWDVDGFYYYRPKTAADKSTPYAATDESKIEELELDKQYDFDAAELPYLIFHADNVIDKVLKLSVTGSSKVDFYISSNKAKIMTYQADKLSGDFYKCETQNIYIMLRPKEYDFSEGVTQPKCSFTFTDFTPELEKCLSIDKAIVASNGKIYASGTTEGNTGKTELFCIDPSDSFSKKRIKNFYEDIYTINELENGYLYVSYKDCISKVNIATEDVTEVVKDLKIKATNVAMYKTGDLVIIGEELQTTAEHGYLVNTTSGAAVELKYKEYPFNLTSTMNLQYISEKDLFIYERYGTPYDVFFLKIDITDPSNPTYVTCDSLTYDYKFNYPIKVFNTSPLQLLTAAGEIFNINVENCEVDPTKDNDYINKLKSWCTYEDVICRSYKDCCILGDYIYYLNYSDSENLWTIEKCELSNPKKVLKQKTYENEKAVKLYKSGNKLYLLSNSAKSIYEKNNYKVFLHEIDF